MIPPCAANVSGVNILSSGNNIDAVLLFTLPVGPVSAVVGIAAMSTALTGLVMLILDKRDSGFGEKEVSGVGAMLTSCSSSLPTFSTKGKMFSKGANSDNPLSSGVNNVAATPPIILFTVLGLSCCCPPPTKNARPPELVNNLPRPTISANVPINDPGSVLPETTPLTASASDAASIDVPASPACTKKSFTRSVSSNNFCVFLLNVSKIPLSFNC